VKLARKRWIAGTLLPTGKLIIDEGAVQALMKGKSLLPAGVRKVDGQFVRGDTVSIVGPDGEELARGLVAYGSADAARIAGQKTGVIEKTLGIAGRPELIHRDNMVILGGDKL
jgi:glutamate 5-kinase